MRSNFESNYICAFFFFNFFIRFVCVCECVSEFTYSIHRLSCITVNLHYIVLYKHTNKLNYFN